MAGDPLRARATPAGGMVECLSGCGATVLPVLFLVGWIELARVPALLVPVLLVECQNELME